jgi:hypothetical protein
MTGFISVAVSPRTSFVSRQLEIERSSATRLELRHREISAVSYVDSCRRPSIIRRSWEVHSTTTHAISFSFPSCPPWMAVADVNAILERT